MKRTFTRLSALLLVLLLTLPLALSAGAAETADEAEELTYICPPEDFEDYTVGANTLPAADFGGLPSEYSIKEENGNKYFSLPNVEANNDKSIAMKVPGNTADPDAKLIIQASYRYDKKAEAESENQFIVQLLSKNNGWRWSELMLLKTYDGSIQVQDTGGGRTYLSYNLEPGKWYDFMWAFDPAAGLLNIYINGELVAAGLPYGGPDYVIAENSFFAAKTLKGSYTDADKAVSLEVDNCAMYYAPSVTLTLDGVAEERAYGDVLDLNKVGYTLTEATVVCNGETSVTTETQIPLLADTQVTTTYTEAENDYLYSMDFEDLETGEPDLSEWFTSVPTSGYEIKEEEDGNKYVSMSLGTYNDAFILANPATNPSVGRVVIEVSYRYTAQEDSSVGYFICQITQSWTTLVLIRSSGGTVYVCEDRSPESGVKLEPDVWNDLRIIVDPVTDTVDLYINDELVVAGRRLGGATPKDIETIAAGQLIIAKVAGDRDGGAEATLDIDNIAVYYDEGGPTPVTYTVIWNVGGNIITETYNAGETPVYPGEEPTREADDEYSYTFAGWSPTPAPLTGNVTYLVKWTQTPLENPDNPDDPQLGGDETDDETEAVTTTTPAGDDSQPGGSGTDAADEPEKGCASGLHGAAGLAAVCVLLALPLALCPRRRKE